MFYNRILRNEPLLKNRNLFLMVLDAQESRIKMPTYNGISLLHYKMQKGVTKEKDGPKSLSFHSEKEAKIVALIYS